MPQRFLRPGIRTSEAWNKAAYSAQSLYISILTLVDDFGRYDGRAALLHGECRSLRIDSKPQETAADLRQLDQLRLIQLYESEGKEYLQVLKWQERTRSEHSKFPVPPQETAGNRSIPQGKDASLVPAIVPSSPPREGVKNGESLIAHQKRIGAWYKRRESTPWSEPEIARLRKLEPIAEDDLTLLESYYTAKFQPDKDYRRRDLMTLLNNWNGELDRARQFVPKGQYSKHL